MALIDCLNAQSTLHPAPAPTMTPPQLINDLQPLDSANGKCWFEYFTPSTQCSADHCLHSPPHPLLIGSSDWKSYLQILSQRCRQRDDVERHQCSIHQPCPLLDKHTLISDPLLNCNISIFHQFIHHPPQEGDQPMNLLLSNLSIVANSNAYQ